LTMFIRARKKIDILAEQAVVPRNHIGKDGRKNVSYVGQAVYVVNGRRQIELVHARKNKLAGIKREANQPRSPLSDSVVIIISGC
jgi:hypothetical protein